MTITTDNRIMKSNFALRPIFLTFLVCLLQITHAQYSIGWYTIDAGGGTSASGLYSVSGTIGQSDASEQTMTGGQYSLTGGFWALYAVQTPGAPLLTITLTTANTVVVRWAYPSTGWNLQENSDLSTTNWVAPSEMINNDGTNDFIIVNPPAANKFYRLFKP